MIVSTPEMIFLVLGSFVAFERLHKDHISLSLKHLPLTVKG